MTGTTTGPALLELGFVLGSKTSRCYITWSYKLLSGARKRGRVRAAKLPIGIDDLRGHTDEEMVRVLADALAQHLYEIDNPMPPASPGGGTTGGEQLSLFRD